MSPGIRVQRLRQCDKRQGCGRGLAAIQHRQAYAARYARRQRAGNVALVGIGLASWLLFKERLGRAKWLGIGLCLLGAAMVIVSRNPNLMQVARNAWVGDLLILGCVMAWGAYSLLSRELNQTLGPVQTVTWSVLWGTLMLTLATLATGRLTLQGFSALQLAQWYSLLYLGVLGSALAYIGYYDGIRRIGATRSGVFIALNPLTAVICGALLLDEALTVPMLAGGAVILLGIYLCNKPLAQGRAMGI